MSVEWNEMSYRTVLSEQYLFGGVVTTEIVVTKQLLTQKKYLLREQLI